MHYKGKEKTTENHGLFVQSIVLYHSLDHKSQQHNVKAVHFNPKKKFWKLMLKEYTIKKRSILHLPNLWEYVKVNVQIPHIFQAKRTYTGQVLPELKRNK